MRDNKLTRAEILTDMGASPKQVVEDAVIHPIYYQGRDVMDIINRYDLSFCLGTVLKYILRAKSKNGVEDLKKARWYLDEEIRLYENKS